MAGDKEKELRELYHRDEQLTRHIHTLSEQRKETRDRIAELECPFKVGENIISSAGERAQVIKVVYGYGPYEFWYKRRIKGGGIGNLERKAYSFQNWRKDDER